jgi:DNA-directed RNA polymerase subunit F
MALDDPSWKILGSSMQLGVDSQLHIQGADLNNRLNNINNYPGIKEWIGNQDDWRDILRSFAGGRVYGGQKRRLGRFLLACNIDAFLSQLTLQVNNLQRTSSQAEVTFHICCGLAGGTGSGSIIDVIAQIRKHYPYSLQGLNYTILAYTYLPEKNPNPKWDTGNYQANGYAALTELNALSAGRFDPYNIAAGGRIPCEVAFNGLYLFTNQNERNVIVEVEHDVPQIVADFLYQKIVAVRHLAWTSLNFLEDAQNGDSTPEIAPLPNTRIPERAKRFLTFGINRVAIPEEEIKEYLTYNFARQAALQLQFNHWDDSEGFLEVPKTQDFNDLVAQKTTQLNWLLTDEHLCLSKGILPADIDKKWSTLEEDWRIIAPHFKDTVLTVDKEERLVELEKLFHKRFEQDFRSRGMGEIGGVDNFYRFKQATQKTMAKEIRQKIEEELFTDWKNGSKSIHELVELVSALLSSLKGRKKGINTQRLTRDHQVREAAKQVDLLKHKWATRGMFTNTTQLLDKQVLNLKDLYTARTWVVALHFADKLLDELMNELQGLLVQLNESANLLSEAAKEFKTMLKQRLNQEQATEMARQVRLYDPERIKSVTKTLLSEEQMQRTYTTKVREEIVKRLGSHPHFAAFNQLGTAAFLDTLVIESAKNAQLGHDKFIQHPKDKLFGVSIIDKLKERYEGDTQALRLYIAELVKYACNYLSFDNAEIQKTGPGIPTSSSKFSRFTVIMPQAPQHAQFMADLKNTFRQSYNGEIEFLESAVNQHEIVMINLTNLFPLRFVTQVSFLRDKYLSRIHRPDAARTKLELHTEGDGSQFPNLFVPSMEEVKTQAIPYLLIAKALGLMVSSEHPKTGAPQLLFLQKDEDGFDLEPIYLGETLVDSYNKLDLGYLEQLKSQVTKLLDGDCLHRDKRNQLKTIVLSEVNQIKQADCGDDLNHPTYQRFNEGGKTAVKILKA